MTTEFPAIDEIESVMRKAKLRFMGLAAIHEEAFFVGTTKLKASICAFYRSRGIDTAKLKDTGIIDIIDGFEAFAEDYKLRLAGLIWLNEKGFWAGVEKIRKAFEIESARPLSDFDIDTNDPDAIVRKAKTEAAEIIAEARREADRIRLGLK